MNFWGGKLWNLDFAASAFGNSAHLCSKFEDFPLEGFSKSSLSTLNRLIHQIICLESL